MKRPQWVGIVDVNAPPLDSERLTHEVRRIRSDAYAAYQLDMPESGALLDAYAAELDRRRVAVRGEELARESARATRRVQRARRRDRVSIVIVRTVDVAVKTMFVGAVIAVIVALAIATVQLFSLNDSPSVPTPAAPVGPPAPAPDARNQSVSDWARSNGYTVTTHCPAGTTTWALSYTPGETRCYDGQGHYLGNG